MLTRLLKLLESSFRGIAITCMVISFLLLLYKAIYWLLRHTSFTIPAGPSLVYVFIFFIIGLWLAIFSEPLWEYIEKKQRLAQGLAGIRNPLELLDLLDHLKRAEPKVVAELSGKLIKQLEQMKYSSEPEVWENFILCKKKELNRFREIIEMQHKEQREDLQDLVQLGENLLKLDEFKDPKLVELIEAGVRQAKKDLENN